MEKKKIIYIIFICIIFVFGIFYVYFQYFYLKPNYNFSNNSYSYHKKEEKKEAINDKNDISVSEIKSYIQNISKEKFFKNPFISKSDIILKKHLQNMELPQLVAIIKTGKKICVILDDKIYHEGEKIGKFKIVKIAKDYVILKSKKKYFKLVAK